MASPPAARRRASPPQPDASPAPDAASLREAALAHLTRYGTSTARLLRVLDRRIDRWARRQAAEPAADRSAIADAAAIARATARDVVRRLAETGIVDDAAFARARTRALLRSGRSRRAVGAHLAAQGIAADLARDAVGRDALALGSIFGDASMDPEDIETAAAAAAARRRRLGPFRAAADADPDRELAVLLRAGFPHRTARAALALTREAAETLIARLRQG